MVGFDDIQSAAFQNPGLTTVRQPLREMGVVAAETLLRRITAPANAPYPKEIAVEPSLVVRASTTTAPCWPIMATLLSRASEFCLNFETIDLSLPPWTTRRPCRSSPRRLRGIRISGALR